MTPVEGPRCPKCRCNDTKVRRRPVRWGRMMAERRCDHCGYEWCAPEGDPKAPEVNGVAYNAVNCRCPVCKAPNPPVTSKPGGGIRYHRCARCGSTFKSVQTGQDPQETGP